MARRLYVILKEALDTGDPNANKEKWYVRKIDKKHYGRFAWNSGKKNFERKGGKYTDKVEAQNAAKITAL